MKFGWLTLSASPAPEADRERIADQIALAEAAEAAGFSDVWLTEHYFTGESVYCDALTFAAALAMRTTRLRIGFAVVQAPFHHPVRLATQLSLLDNLSGGRIDIGVGKGTVYNEYEFVGYGLGRRGAVLLPEAEGRGQAQGPVESAALENFRDLRRRFGRARRLHRLGHRLFRRRPAELCRACSKCAHRDERQYRK